MFLYVAVADEIGHGSRLLGVFTCYSDARSALDSAARSGAEGRYYVLGTRQNHERTREENEQTMRDPAHYYECIVRDGERVVTGRSAVGCGSGSVGSSGSSVDSRGADSGFDA
jgi:hypothetical protein